MNLAFWWDLDYNRNPFPYTLSFWANIMID